jgi:membrane-associated phospholipid phosphatase
MISTGTPANVTPDVSAAHGTAVRNAGRASAWWASAYLVVTGLVFAVTGQGALALVHLALLCLLAWAAVAKGNVAGRVLDILPLIVVIAFAYGEVPSLIATFSIPFHDATVQGWEQTLFGAQPAHVLAGKLPALWLSELLHAGYMSFYVALSVPPLLLYMRGDTRAFEETTLALVVTWIVCCGLFAVFPVQGPRFVWTSPPGVPDGPFRRLSLFILANGSARGTAFPSLHMAASLSQTVMAWRWQRGWVRYAMTASTVLVAIGAVYAGYHYAIDMVAGTLLGGATTAGVVLFSRWRAAVSGRA